MTVKFKHRSAGLSNVENSDEIAVRSECGEKMRVVRRGCQAKQRWCCAQGVSAAFGG
jgi:hypothetical protein